MKPADSGSAPAAPRPTVEVVLKWVAAVAAVLSLIAGSFQVTRLFSDVRERKRLIAETLDVAQRQQSGGDFASAWATLETGLKSADEGGQFAKLFGQLSDERRRLRLAQEDVAMAWLRNVRVPADRKFSDVVDRLLPVLDRGVTAATGSARADRLAHVGWAYFLKSRDGAAGLDPASRYRAALEADPDNPYAHAYWGHWMLWQREPLAGALLHFDAAARNERARPYVRSIEHAALRVRSDAQSSAALLRLAATMRRNGESVSVTARNDVYSIYHSVVMNGTPPAAELLAALPPAAHLELIDGLVAGPETGAGKQNVAAAARALFQEAAGDTTAALATWRALRAGLDANEVTLRARADAALRRLQATAGDRRR